MKKHNVFFKVFSVLMLLCVILTSCNNAKNPEGDSESISEPLSESANDSTSTPESDDESATDSASQSQPDEESKPSEPPITSAVPESLKVLAIGNSFSTDAMEYLYQVAKACGVKTVVLGNLYYSGCSLDTHYSYAFTNSASYTYYKNTTGSWKNTKNYKFADAVTDEDWDYITIQQTSKTCGIASSYGKLSSLCNIIRSKNETAELVWHMTWAYQQDSTHSSFPKYDNDQIKMYNMIIDCVENSVLSTPYFSRVIPTGTAIQNARTSFYGDHLTRDGYHLDKNIGRYIAALTYFAALTNVSIENISYNPSKQNITDDMVQMAIESVTNAILNPMKITESKLKDGDGGPADSPSTTIDPSEVLVPGDFFEADKALAAKSGINLDNYTLLEWEYLENQYWNCTSKSGLTKPSSSAGTYNENVCSQKKYTLEELPAGTLFVLDSGWQFRLDTYISENATYTGKRLDFCRDPLTVFNEDLIRDCNYFAWNISSNPKSDISDRFAQAACHLRIYIPTT